MAANVDAITLVPLPIEREKDVNKCILCQKEKRSEKTASTENGRKKIIDASTKMNDSILKNLNDSELNKIRYHSRECYKPYILKAERFRPTTSDDNPPNDTTVEGDETTPKRSKRRKSRDTFFFFKGFFF